MGQQCGRSGYGDVYKRQKLDRLSKVDLSILRLAAAEMRYMEKIPYKVAVNEAVELAKKYSEEKAPQFINGILRAMAEDYLAEQA